jgi:hypothetical protein
MAGFSREPIKFDKAILVFGRSDNLVERISLECESPSLSDSLTTLSFSTRTFSEGVFRVASLKLIMGKVSFFKDFTKPGIPITEVNFHQRGSDVNATVALYPKFTLVDKHLVVDVNAPYDITSCRVKLTPLNPNVQFEYLKAEAVRNCKTTKNVVPNCVALGDVSSGSTVSCIVPIHSQFDYNELNVRVLVEYETHGVPASIEFQDTVAIGLAVNVQVQDYFKIFKLLSRFEISSREIQSPVRIEEVELHGSPHFDVSAPLGTKAGHISFSGKPIHYVFAIERNSGQNGEQFLLLTVRHRYLKSGKFPLNGPKLEIRLTSRVRRACLASFR